MRHIILFLSPMVLDIDWLKFVVLTHVLLCSCNEECKAGIHWALIHSCLAPEKRGADMNRWGVGDTAAKDAWASLCLYVALFIVLLVHQLQGNHAYMVAQGFKDSFLRKRVLIFCDLASASEVTNYHLCNILLIRTVTGASASLRGEEINFSINAGETRFWKDMWKQVFLWPCWET